MLPMRNHYAGVISEMSASIDWQDERNVEQLKELAGMGLSLGEMALVMRCSRNTVAGKLYRLGLVHPKPETWTQERIDQLKSMWANGFSKREIAAQMGLSAATVFSKATKIGLRGDHQLPSSRRRKEWPAQKPPKSEAQKLKAPRLSIEWKEYIMGTGVKLFDLEPHHCRWPLNEVERGGEYFFCGAKKHDDGPYCPYHTDVARFGSAMADGKQEFLTGKKQEAA